MSLISTFENIPLSTLQEAQERREEIANEMRQNAIIKKMCYDLFIDPSLIDKYPMKFKIQLEEIEKCKGCRGYSNCNRDTKGIYKQLHFDGMLEFKLKKCKYFNEAEFINGKT